MSKERRIVTKPPVARCMPPPGGGCSPSCSLARFCFKWRKPLPFFHACISEEQIAGQPQTLQRFGWIKMIKKS